MIDYKGQLRCDTCGKLHMLYVDGSDYHMEWYCPGCHHYHREIRHTEFAIDKHNATVVLSK